MTNANGSYVTHFVTAAGCILVGAVAGRYLFMGPVTPAKSASTAQGAAKTTHPVSEAQLNTIELTKDAERRLAAFKG